MNSEEKQAEEKMERIKKEGFAAHQTGLETDACPYEPKSPEWVAWFVGYTLSFWGEVGLELNDSRFDKHVERYRKFKQDE